MKRVVAWVWLLASWASAADVPLSPAVTKPDISVPAKSVERKGEVRVPFTVAVWNIQWFPGGRPDADEQAADRQRVAVRKELMDLAPDILMASEIRSLEAWRSLGLPHRYLACTAIPRPADENPDLPNQGLALASRIPWSDIWVLDFSGLPQTRDRPSRGILGARFELGAGRVLTIYGVHFKSNRGDAEGNRLRRGRAVDYLTADWKKRGLDPARDAILVMGDFNTSLRNRAFAEETTLRRLLDAGFRSVLAGLPDAEAMTGFAHPSGLYPANDFDHILYSEPARDLFPGSGLRGEIRPGRREWSDHRPVVLRWEKPVRTAPPSP